MRRQQIARLQIPGTDPALVPNVKGVFFSCAYYPIPNTHIEDGGNSTEYFDNGFGIYRPLCLMFGTRENEIADAYLFYGLFSVRCQQRRSCNKAKRTKFVERRPPENYRLALNDGSEQSRCARYVFDFDSTVRQGSPKSILGPGWNSITNSPGVLPGRIWKLQLPDGRPANSSSSSIIAFTSAMALRLAFFTSGLNVFSFLATNCSHFLSTS